MVPVARLRPAPGDPVPVDVVDRLRDRLQAREAALLPRLAQGDREQVGVPVRVSAELQPLAELPVERQQRPCAVGADDPCRAGQVARQAGAKEAVRVRDDERGRLL